MRTCPRRTLFFALTALTGACADQPYAVAPSFSRSGAAACPTPANVVVTDETGLTAALAAAYPGEVIGLAAFFGVTADVAVTTPNVTLTCAAPGAGIFAAPGAGVIELFTAGANGIVVDRLVLKDSAGDPNGDPYVAIDVAGVRLTNSRIICSPGSCGFLAGTSGAVIADNRFESAGSFTGVHMQGSVGGIDGSRVERNTIIATAPSTAFGFGGIRVRDGSNVVVAANIVQGPWSNSIATTDVAASSFGNNRLAGAVVNGIRFNVGPLLMIDNVFQSNQVTGAGSAGVFSQSACRNLFVGNALQGNGGNVGLVFAATTGANTFVGNQTIVVDDGAFDCNGDGVADPNIITGGGAVRHGVTLGDVVSGAVRTIHGITLQ